MIGPSDGTMVVVLHAMYKMHLMQAHALRSYSSHRLNMISRSVSVSISAFTPDSQLELELDQAAPPPRLPRRSNRLNALPSPVAAPVNLNRKRAVPLNAQHTLSIRSRPHDSMTLSQTSACTIMG